MARNDVMGALPGGGFGNVSAYNRSPEGARQNQLRAQAMGLDLKEYELYQRSPTNYINQHRENFDPATGVFKIPNVTPGALISNNGPVRGPNGIILAAGSTAANPLDLATIQPASPITGGGHNADTSGWIASNLSGGTAKNFLPPYLQPGAAPSTGGAVDIAAPTGQAAAPIVPTAPTGITPAGSPMAPFVPQGVGQVPGQPLVTGASRIGGGFGATAKLLELPYYLRRSYG